MTCLPVDKKIEKRDFDIGLWDSDTEIKQIILEKKVPVPVTVEKPVYIKVPVHVHHKEIVEVPKPYVVHKPYPFKVKITHRSH